MENLKVNGDLLKGTKAKTRDQHQGHSRPDVTKRADCVLRYSHLKCAQFHTDKGMCTSETLLCNFCKPS